MVEADRAQSFQLGTQPREEAFEDFRSFAEQSVHVTGLRDPRAWGSFYRDVVFVYDRHAGEMLGQDPGGG
jgi:hypothetical protein